MDKREETVEEKNGKTQNMKKTEVKFLVLNPRISLSVGVQLRLQRSSVVKLQYRQLPSDGRHFSILLDLILQYPILQRESTEYLQIRR